MSYLFQQDPVIMNMISVLVSNNLLNNQKSGYSYRYNNGIPINLLIHYCHLLTVEWIYGTLNDETEMPRFIYSIKQTT